MANAIKVDRTILLDALTARLAEQDKFRADYKKAEEKHEKAQKVFADKLLALAKSGKLAVEDISYRSWNNTLEIEFKVDRAIMPQEPERPKTPEGWIHDHDYEELRRTIRAIGMTTDPKIPMSLYKSVAQWL